ncbi:P-loop containing nucleoside triphosphate hydrolase protein [Zychaea mexicana]|uniref:P-loop containing nucleoside triphosphate hydrolase protein n=1 Tax=Zychaea mexicana TaxID=64656 RepID=UPI0022FF3AC2|nr:P-loop containing nucleoside triphosphate hydrolase protein [Zychaea mexicana]KAI9496233.1 P-loop containing nucleoside triphosphate hydrolase protein [Zychaea mexicana]
MFQRTIQVVSSLSRHSTRNVARVISTGPRSIVRSPALSNVRWARMLHNQPGLYYTAAATASASKDPTITAAAEQEPTMPAAVEDAQQQPRRFSDLQTIHPLSQKALKSVFKYDTMSAVQDAVLSRLPDTNDMFVKAKTGTGKTLAFLIAALEKVVAGKDKSDLRHYDGSSIFIISPTRELAHQIAEEANKLTKFYPLNVHCFVGGESKMKQIKALERSRCDIVVGTPGRLNDMLESRAHFRKMVATTQVLVLDEADQLVDMGFKQEVERILKHLPKQDRQTMLFSATLSDEIRGSIGKFALSPKYDLIDTVGEEDVNTHLHVKQSALVAPYKEQIPLLRNLLSNYEAANEGKTIVFLPTTKSTMVYAQLFQHLLPGRRVYELHSRKSQNDRSRIAARFKQSRPGTILFTSDVSARGVDYPGVSLVVQVGIPSSREQYIHRLGRTGRAGNSGEGILVAAPFEDAFIKSEIGDLPVKSLVAPEISETEQEETTRIMKYFQDSKLDEDFVREMYTAYLGYYVGRMVTLRRSRSDTLEHAESFLRAFGVEDIPYLSQKFIQQVGLSEKKREQRSFPSRRGGDRRDSGRFGSNRRFDDGGDFGGYKRRDSGRFSSNRRFDDSDDFGGYKRRSSSRFDDRDSNDRPNRRNSFGKRDQDRREPGSFKKFNRFD